MKLCVGPATSWLLTLALAAPAAESPAFSRVAMLLPACEQPGLGSSELREAVALDLRDERLTLAPAGELSPATDVLVRIEAACSADSELTLHAEYVAERHTRRVDLSELPPPQRARALSLAVAELLALFGQPPAPPSTTDLAPASAAPLPTATSAAPVASIAAGATTPPPAPKTPAPATRRSALQPDGENRADRPRTSPVPAEWRLAVAPELRFFDTTWLWGGRVLAHYGPWSAGLDLLRAQESMPAGRVTTLVVHGTFVYSFVLMGGVERSSLEAGLRFGLGRAFMAAEASMSARAYDAQDVYLDAAFGARYSLRLSTAFRIGIGGELGYARGPIGYADDREVASTSGSFASLLVDVSMRL